MSGRRPAPVAPRRRTPPPRRRFWCCSLGGGSPQTPDRRTSVLLPSPKNPFPTTRLGLGRILSPGRVSPLPTVSAPALDPLPEVKSPEAACRPYSGEGCLEVRMKLKGKDGGCVVLELDPEVLSESSTLFKAMVLDSLRKAPGVLANCREIEVDDVEDLDALRETIEMMYQKDLVGLLVKAGVSRAIDILEVSSNIRFNRGVMSCLKYLEAVPWNESDEDKLRSLFARCTLDEATSSDVLARLGPHGSTNLEDLAIRLIQLVADGSIGNTRKEMQSLVNGLLSKSSVYQKDPAGLNKESLYCICYSFLNSLVGLFEEASGSIPVNRTVMMKETKPLVERVSKQVDSINWLLEILIEKQMAEDFVSLWANQEELVEMYEKSSPMIRYELSRISACVFIALGRGKLQCPGCTRFSVFHAWFRPMVIDFGWLRRCSKGLDMKMLEESLGQALLTLPLKQQQVFFEEWFQCLSGQGTECPNLSNAFQVWWRRSNRSLEARCQRESVSI